MEGIEEVRDRMDGWMDGRREDRGMGINEDKKDGWKEGGKG